MTTDPANHDRDVLEPLTDMLIAAPRALGAAGQPETANRLAGRAWATLRRTHHGQAQRVNALMHQLARMPSDPTHDQGAPQCLTASSTSGQSHPPAATA